MKLTLILLLLLVSFCSFGQKIGILSTSSFVDDSTYLVGQQSTLGTFGLALKVPYWQIKQPIIDALGDSSAALRASLSAAGQGLKKTLQVGNVSDTGLRIGKNGGLFPYNGFTIDVDAYGRVAINMRDTGRPDTQTRIYIRSDSAVSFLMPVTLQYLLGYGSAPTISFDASAGTSALDSVYGTEGWGWFSFQAGTMPSVTSNPFLYLSVTNKNRVPSYIVISPRNDNAASIWNYTKSMLYCTTSSTSTATISVTDNTYFITGQHYSYYYDIRGYKR